MVDKSSTKQQFQEAHALITAQKYQQARELLQQIDHPKAQDWLAQLEDKTRSKRSTAFSTPLLLFGVTTTVLILSSVLAVMYLPTLIESMQPNTSEQYRDDLENIVVTDEEIFYSHVASYCYQITGYGGELCLDWADLVIAEHQNTVRDCLAPFITYQSNQDIMDTSTDENDQAEELHEEDFIAMSTCLTDAGVPDPF